MTKKQQTTLTPRHQLPRGHTRFTGHIAWSAGRPQKVMGDKRRRRLEDKLRRELRADR